MTLPLEQESSTPLPKGRFQFLWIPVFPKWQKAKTRLAGYKEKEKRKKRSGKLAPFHMNERRTRLWSSASSLSGDQPLLSPERVGFHNPGPFILLDPPCASAHVSTCP